jgi:hypothetical protein
MCLTDRTATAPIARMDESKIPPVSGRRSDLRREREAAALRANLLRRKQQQRAREVPAAMVPCEDDRGGSGDDAPDQP